MKTRVFLAMLLRDATVARRELPVFLLRTALQPIMLTIVFGLLMPRMGFMARGYAATILPGVIGLSIAFAGIQAVSLPMVADFGFTKEIEDRLLAPVPMMLIPIEKIVAGVLQGLLAALVVLPVARLIMGPIPALSFANAGIVFIAMILAGAAFSSLGLFLGTAVPPQHVSLMFSVILAPMVMFGCAYYPWRGLDAVPLLKWLVTINPLTYVSEAIRGTLTPSTPHMPIWVTFVALVILTAIFTQLGLRAFRKRAIS
jgi:ABC-2 type transport system permease protein